MARLRSFKKWPANWDGEGAPRPNSQVLDSAITLLSLIVPFRVSLAVALDSESRPTFYVRDGAYDGYIAIEEDRSISFYFRKDHEVLAEYDVPFDNRSLPGELRDVLMRLK